MRLGVQTFYASNFMLPTVQSSDPPLTEAFLSEIDAEVDVEIALRQRLAETVESRIAWALILQETLQKGMHNAC